MDFPKLEEPELKKRLNVPTGKLRLIIDSDTMNEVDDQFAIAWALRSKERFDLEAMYAVPFSHDCFNQFNKDADVVKIANSVNGHSEDPSDGMEQSYHEIIRICELMNEPTEGRVVKGSGKYMPDVATPVESPAARDLIKRAMEGDGLLYVAAIGAATNIASAILMEPQIINKIVVAWLGGHMPSVGHGIEFNLIQDVLAAQVLFNSGVPLIWVPCMNVAALLTVSDAELKEKLLPLGGIGTYLANTVLEAFKNPASDIAMMELIRGSSLRDNNDQPDEYLKQFPTYQVAWSRIIWDIAVIAALKNPNWTPSKLIPSPVLTDDFKWNTDGRNRHPIRMLTYCHRNMIFGDLFAALREN